MYGKKRPQWILDKLKASTTGRKKTLAEKVLRLVKLPNRKELVIEKDGESIHCFSYSHAAKLIGVRQQSVEGAVKRGSFKCKGWSIILTEKKYTEKLVMDNLDLFDVDVHPQAELISMLESL